MTATVPRQLVHRAAVAETFLTDWVTAGTDRFCVSAQWPRAHSLFVSPDRATYEPLLVIETVRQCGALLAHAEYGVPLGHQFVLQELRVTTYPEHLAVAGVPAELVLGITCSEIQRRGSVTTGIRYRADVRRDGAVVARAEVGFSCVSESVYRRLRGGRTPASVSALSPPPGIPAAAVHRTTGADVVLAPADKRGRWQLRVDTGHPVLFDHPLDHVPGMLFLEAARQAVRVRVGSAGRVQASFHATFHRYAELDRPTWMEVVAAEEDGTQVRVAATQDEQTVFECTVGTVAIAAHTARSAAG
ncbi:ScbA/BarX family gamma-butyrolactone biosynthesis protein [Streptomyces sp. NPDC058467]|uniref:ScbA/BarX family gamma-butyrolactone biosynthesis protein n=1 Tax=unclassified Streptomyces TaxID=2593676 RepID=UPI00365B130F